MEKNPQFLKKKYDLHNSPEVETAARHTEERNKIRNQQFIASGQEGPLRTEKISSPEERIQTYIYEILRPEDPDFPGEGLPKFKKYVHDNFVIKPESIPESVFVLEQRIARERGQVIEITDEFREQKINELIGNQKQSLDKWIDYLASPDALYPDWFKYVALRSILEMGKFKKEQDANGKERGFFQKRTADTVAAFPTLNQRALATTLDTLNAQLTEQTKAKNVRQKLTNLSTKLEPKEFQALAATEDFNKIYTQFLIELPEYSTEGLQEIRGKWVKYNQGSDPKPLVDSLEVYPLEWCTAGYDTAKTQLEGGDFYIYYSRDKDGEDKIPRVAIRMEGDSIAEVRGIAPGQNTDPYITPVIEQKMEEFGKEGEKYKKRAKDMEWLAAIEKKMTKNEPLTKDDLVFLYEFNCQIEGFGYGRAPRIDEIIRQRSPKKDMLMLFDLLPQDVVFNTHFLDIIEEKVYRGENITRDELIRLYEINGPALVINSSYGRDGNFLTTHEKYVSAPFGEIRKLRDKKLDASILFDCSPDQIAISKDEINDRTKIYIGQLFSGLFTQFAFLEHIYTSFPESEIYRDNVKIGSKDVKQLEINLIKSGVKISENAKSIMQHPEFSPQKKAEEAGLIRLTVEDLGFSKGSTIAEIYKKAEELGLELCPAEVGPQYRLSYATQPMNEYLYVAMKTISDPDGNPNAFYLYRDVDGLQLKCSRAKPNDQRGPRIQFVFRLPKKSTPETPRPLANSDQHPSPPTA